MSDEESSSGLVQEDGGGQDVGLERMVARIVKQAIEAERAKSTASVGTSQAGGHSVSGRRNF